MNLKGIRESTNYVDTSAAPWYDPNKLLSAATIAIHRALGSQKQAQLDEVQRSRDENPIAMSPQEAQANYNSKVTRSPDGKGWTIQRPGAQFDEYAPDYVDSKVIQSVLKQAGLAK